MKKKDEQQTINGIPVDSVVNPVLAVIEDYKEWMDERIQEKGLTYFAMESAFVNDSFCFDLDNPHQRLQDQIDMLDRLVDYLEPDRDAIKGGQPTCSIDEGLFSEEFCTEYAESGGRFYRHLLDEYNPGRNPSSGVMAIRTIVMARMVYSCLRSDDIDDAAVKMIGIMRTSMPIIERARLRSTKSPMERFMDAVAIYDGTEDAEVQDDPGLGIAIMMDLVEIEFPPALNYIGSMYFTGEWFEKDQAKGFQMIERAAELGFPKSMLNLSKMYRTGQYVDVDIAKADEYESKAVEMGYLAAIIHHYQRTGEITERSIRALIAFAMDNGAMTI